MQIAWNSCTADRAWNRRAFNPQFDSHRTEIARSWEIPLPCHHPKRCHTARLSADGATGDRITSLQFRWQPAWPPSCCWSSSERNCFSFTVSTSRTSPNLCGLPVDSQHDVTTSPGSTAVALNGCGWWWRQSVRRRWNPSSPHQYRSADCTWNCATECFYRADARRVDTRPRRLLIRYEDMWTEAIIWTWAKSSRETTKFSWTSWPTWRTFHQAESCWGYETFAKCNYEYKQTSTVGLKSSIFAEETGRQLFFKQSLKTVWQTEIRNNLQNSLFQQKQ